MPTQKFYASLRNYESQHFELFRELLIDAWPTYHNEKYNFSLCYPLDGRILDNEENSVRIDLPVLVGTNLKEKSLTIHCKEDGILSSPLSMRSPIGNMFYDINVLGLKFLRESGWAGAMHKQEEWISYSTLRENKVITISLKLMSVSYEAYLPVLLSRIDLISEQEVLLYVLSTFSWLD